MIENVTQYVLGVCIGCILYLIYEVFSLYKDIEFHRNIEFIINDSEYNKEVLEHFINKLNKLNDSIKAKVDDQLASILHGGSPRSVA